jgi:hypothetical protein
MNYWYNKEWPDWPESGSLDDYAWGGISVAEIKKLLKKNGGTACARFFDRAGNITAIREITLKGDNTTKSLLSNPDASLPKVILEHKVIAK